MYFKLKGKSFRFPLPREMAFLGAMLVMTWVFFAYTFWVHVNQKEYTAATNPPQYPDLSGQVENLQGQLAAANQQVTNLQNQAQPPPPSETNIDSNRMGMGQAAELATGLAFLLKLDSPVSIVITAPQTPEAQKFRRDLLQVVQEACSIRIATASTIITKFMPESVLATFPADFAENGGPSCTFPELPNPSTDLDATLPEPTHEGIVIHQDDNSPSIKFGGPDYASANFRCFLAHNTTEVPKLFDQIKTDPLSHTLWIEIGNGSPWKPDAQSGTECSANQ